LARRHALWAAAIFVLALGVRLLFLYAADDRSWPHSLRYEGDAVVWAKSVELLNHGEVPDEGIPTRFYAIAYFLHWLHPSGAIADFLPFKRLWCFLSALTCSVAYLGFVRSFAHRVALIGAGMCVFSFASYVLATSINVEGLYVPLLTLILVGSVEFLWRPRISLALGLAVFHGLAILVRGEHLLVLGLLVLHFLWQGHRQQATQSTPVTLPRRWALAATIALGAFAVCLPYAIRNTQATVRYNTITKKPVDFNGAGVTWSPEARAFVTGLPAFLRGKTVEHVSGVARHRSLDVVTGELAQSLFTEAFGSKPEPLSTPVFVASCGPLDFALANHPDSNGGFSKAALATRFSNDPKLNLAFPGHLAIYNHGYAIGWGYIQSHVGVWLENLGSKLSNAYQGVTLGFTAYNIPLGREGVRRAVDIQTPFPGDGILWRLVLGGLLVLGTLSLVRAGPHGMPWILVVAAKIVVVLAYFGFARQAASIALGVEHVLCALERPHPKPSTPRVRRAAWGVVLVVLCVLEIGAATNARAFTAAGPQRPLAEFGPQAFSSNFALEIRKRDGE
jgi:hypothetical protein